MKCMWIVGFGVLLVLARSALADTFTEVQVTQISMAENAADSVVTIALSSSHRAPMDFRFDASRHPDWLETFKYYLRNSTKRIQSVEVNGGRVTSVVENGNAAKR